MSSVLHPVGPEPRERYWVRRLAVLLAVAVALVVVVALAVNATSAGSAVQAAPAPPALPPVAPDPSASASPSAGTTPSESATPTAAATATPSATVTPSATPSATPTTTSKTPAQKTTTKKSTKKKTTSTTRKTTKKKAQPVLAACPTSSLRTTLTGKENLKTGSKATFALSLINGSGQPCYLRVTSADFTLTVVSGSDRVWTTKDCATTVPTLSRKLAAEQALEWTVRWDGQRSAKGCGHRPEHPKAGTYWAIATFDDGHPVRLRMFLHG